MAGKLRLDWLKAPDLQTLLEILNQNDAQTRVVGGAVRNALLGQPVSDIDIATTLVPRDVILRLKDNDIKTVPTGIEHGTVTAVVDKTSFEITTLRRDIETDGRHATVRYGTDWEEDARRRDLTINALYMEADGNVLDPLGVRDDLDSQVVRFVGEAQQRIREDYLRILRFFRFFAWYGAHRPEAEGLKACAKLKDSLKDLSAERVWQELCKLLAAPAPGRALLWMRQTGVLSAILPETEKWGIDSIPALVDAEQAHDWQPDALLRLMAIVPPNPERVEAMAKRLKLPNVAKERLLRWSNADAPTADLIGGGLARFLYQNDIQAVLDRLRLAIAREGEDQQEKRAFQLEFAQTWQKPVFPIGGKDLKAIGMKPSPVFSATLSQLENRWVESEFRLSREELLATLTET